MAPQFIFTMKDLRKVTPQGKEILKGIWLSFYPGAKIGVLGRQRRGQEHAAAHHGRASTRTSRARPSPPQGTRIGFLPQEPQLDPGKTVLENVEEAVADAARDPHSATRSCPPTGPTRTRTSWAGCRTRSTPRTCGSWTATSRSAMDALRLPPAGRDVTTLSGGERRRVALCRLLLQPNDMLLLDEPTNHLDAESVAWLERFLKEFKGTRGGGDPRPLLPGQRGGLDPRARPRRGHPLGGQLLVLARPEEEPAGPGGEGEPAPPAHAASASWSGCAWRRAPARPRARPASPTTRSCWPRSRPRTSATAAPRSRSRPGPRLGDLVIEAKGLRKAYGDKLLMDDVNFILPRGGIVGVIGPNGAGKTTLFRMIVGQEKPDAGALQVGETRGALLRRPEPRHPERQAHRLGGDLGRRQGHW